MDDTVELCDNEKFEPTYMSLLETLTVENELRESTLETAKCKRGVTNTQPEHIKLFPTTKVRLEAVTVT